MTIDETWPTFVRLARDILTFATWQLARNQSALLVNSVAFFDILGIDACLAKLGGFLNWTTYFKYFWIHKQSNSMKREN